MKNVTPHKINSTFLAVTAFKCFFTAVLFAGIELYGQAGLSGYVFVNNNEPFPGANVLLNNGSFGTVSGTDGKFIFAGLPVGKYELSISALGYKEIVCSVSTDTLTRELVFKLTPYIQTLDEVRINGSSAEKRRALESISVRLVEEEYLKFSRASNLVQTLNGIPGINSMDIGTGISKPMIRGMGYYRVAIAQNGIKQEGQQWSNHHGISVDQQNVQHVEIIKGPASLQYGSDAIGGVINVLTNHIPLKQGISGEMSVTAKSNTRWLGSSAEIIARKGDIYSNMAITYNSFGDFRIPVTDSFLLPAPVSATEASHKVPLGGTIYNTAGKEKAASVLVGIIKPWGNSYLEAGYYNTQNGFFDWQGIQNDSLRLGHASGNFDLCLPWQEVGHFSANHFTNRYFNSDKLEIALGYQSNNSKEYSYLDNRTGNRAAELEYFRNKGNFDLGLRLQTYSANVFYTFRRLKNHTFKLGSGTQYLFHITDGYGHILPEYQRFSSGIFVTHKYVLSPKWVINSGARVDYTYFAMQETLNPDRHAGGDSIFNPTFSKKFASPVISFGVNFSPLKHTTIKFHIGNSYRVPSAYELGAYGLHRHEGRFEKGDTSNKAEKAWQIDLGYERKWKQLTVSLSPFANYFTNYLYLNPTHVLRQEGQVYEYRQTRALLAGGEASVEYSLHKWALLKVGAEYVYAVNLDLKSALPFTPPFCAITELVCNFRNYKAFTGNRFGIELISVAKQKYTVPNELTTFGYNSLNLNLITDLGIRRCKLSLMFKVSNLLNNKHYNHISFYRRLRIPEPARDYQLFISKKF
ncbi:MAG: TonB-dependent receptor [Bacteroidales bacterium]|nr:TonB-dependent receptor [Bacteroidales bacterium]